LLKLVLIKWKSSGNSGYHPISKDKLLIKSCLPEDFIYQYENLPSGNDVMGEKRGEGETAQTGRGENRGEIV
jgi:hypothetical protein